MQGTDAGKGFCLAFLASPKGFARALTSPPKSDVGASYFFPFSGLMATMTSRQMILGASVGVFLPVMISISLINYYFSQRRIAAAQTDISKKITEITEAVTEEKWKVASELLDEAAQLIEKQHLVDAESKEKANVLLGLADTVNKARASQEELERTQQAKLEAIDLIADANKAIDSKDFQTAKHKLGQYLMNTEATDKAGAAKLIACINAMESDSGAVQFLASWSEEDFYNFLSANELSNIGNLNITSFRPELLARLQRNTERAAKTRAVMKRVRQAEREKEFESWVDARVSSRPAKQLFDSYFGGLMNMLDSNSVTNEHRREFKTLEELMDTVGFSVFKNDYKTILREYYNYSNYKEGFFETSVSNRLKQNRGQVVKDVLSELSSVLDKLPK